MTIKKLERSFFQRILGRPATPMPENNDFWSINEGTITVELNLAAGLAQPGSAVRLEGNLPKKILVVHGEDGAYRAYENKCAHMGRRMDPVPGTETIQCCSVGASTFDLLGSPVAGTAKEPLKTHPVSVEGDRLVIRVG